MQCPQRPTSDVFVLLPEDDDQDRCSYCGSLGPDVFMNRLRAGDIEVVPTDKNYKVYVKNNGGEELKSVKFYFYHLSDEQKNEFIDLLNAKKLTIGSPGYFYALPFFIGTKKAEEV